MASGRMRLYDGPLHLPREILSAAPTIRLFMAYLGRDVTRRAILDAARQRPGNAAAQRAVNESLIALSDVGVPRNHEGLRRVIARTPDLKCAALYAAKIDRHIVPATAIPTADILAICESTYHAWIEALSKARF